MRTFQISTLLSIPVLALSLVGCGAPVDDGAPPQEDTTRAAQRATSLPLCRWWGSLPTTLTQDPMNHLYGINPTPHSEAAYQGGDPSAPIAINPTYADASGTITVLQTSLYNRDGALGVRYGTVAHFVLHSPRGTAFCEDSAPIPFRIDIPNLIPGHGYYIQPTTLNTQAKILPTNLAH